MYRLSLLIFALAAAFSSVAVFAQAATETAHGLTVTGTAQITTQPDIAYAVFGVTNVARDAAQAAQANANTTTAVISAITKAGIPKTDIQTINYSVSPEMDYKKSPAVLVGYRVTNSVRAKIRDLTKVGPIIDTALAAGANEVQGVTFGLENEAAARQQALVQAIKNAQLKARAMADALGIRLGPVTAASEASSVSPRPPIPYAIARAEAATTPIAPGEMEVTGNVTVTYAIR